MTKFAHRGFLVDATVATEKGVIETQWGKAIYYEGDLILRDKNENIVVTSERVFKTEYVPVEEVVEKESIRNAYAEALQEFSLEDVASGYGFMGELIKNENEVQELDDEEYRSEFQRKVRERNGIHIDR